ncbi:hypothetical protein AJ78_07202 [Emergomyces pasteurianus Ep9510]|uniref:BTB domain-containing protein n=1 Tax=Emergomyces pasteurianus Ep9510 TaxID=1447872 RepID=A0A1J9QAF1_9EURO|nr:hypothetical protein AJ78_07202 [Emergomyces pasteurianus Ep9510]
MEDIFPSLPGVLEPNGLKHGGIRPATRHQAGEGCLNVKTTRIICSNADVVLEFSTSPSSRLQKLPPRRYLMGASSAALKESSPYFRVILDPDKFREGRELLEKTTQLDSKYGTGEMFLVDAAMFSELPRISVELPPLAGLFDKADLIETFLKVLHFGRTGSQNSHHSTQQILDHLAKKSISFVANLIILSDRFGGQQALTETLNMQPQSGVSRPVGQMLMSKALRHLQTSGIEDEERTRQAIYFALFLGYNDGVVAFTHRLIIDGSKEWIHGYRDGWVGIDRPLWWHLPHGIEGILLPLLLTLCKDRIVALKFLTRLTSIQTPKFPEELHFRQKSILDTITDLQFHFLRAYGALPPESSHPSQITDPTTSALSPPPPQQPKKLQCRRMYENSRACDSFHLGEIIRFFTTRTKTLHLESTLSSQTHYSDSDSEDNNEEHINPQPPLNTNFAHPSSPPTNIPNLLASLRQCPEYQIDANHIGCGLRRRLLPALDCLANFTTNSHSAVGICPIHYNKNNNSYPSCSKKTTYASVGSWRNHQFRDAVMVSIGPGKVDSIIYSNDGCANGALAETCTCVGNAELARAVFTAKRRIWNL